MNEQPQQQSTGGLIRTPVASGGITRGFAKPEAPIELRQLQYKVAAVTIPMVILGGCLAASAYFLSQALQSSPNAQLIQSQREAQTQHAKSIETVAKNAGCGAFTLICVTGETEKSKATLPIPTPRQPQLPQPAQALPDYYEQPQQVAVAMADIDNPQMSVYWSSRMHDVEWTTAAMDMCERDLWQSSECIALSQAWYEVYGE